MGHAWGQGSSVLVDGRELTWRGMDTARGAAEGSVFVIPAHRALLLAEGWPAPFLKLTAEMPAVARLFSQQLYALFASPTEEKLFPPELWKKGAYRDALDGAVFHGGRVRLGKEQLKKRLELEFDGGARLPFMTWTAGQREFTPLLLGLAHLLPQGGERKHPKIDTVIIEEPEMGLHPQAISVVMLLVLELLWRGYKVLLSTHSPLVLDIVFTLRMLQARGADPALLCRAFQMDEPEPHMLDVMKSALAEDMSYRTFYLRFGEGGVTSQDISELDPSSEDAGVSGWGGLTEFSSRFNDVVADAVNAGARDE